MKALPSTIALLLGLAFATPASAQIAILRPQFRGYDSNRDEKITRSEFPGSNEQFAAMDRDKSGTVSFDEYRNSAVARNFLSARNQETGPPRDRLDPERQRVKSLAVVNRFDSNKDGRVTRSEWTGAPGTFLNLDINRDDVIDATDKRLAERRAEADKKGTYDEFGEFTYYLDRAEDILKRRDKNKDLLLTQVEIGSAKFAMLFDLADANYDKVLDLEEIRGMVRNVARRVRERNIGTTKIRAYIVPFSTWDKDDDGRLDTGEWLQRKYLFPRIDVDRDGGVTKQEVARYKISVEGETFVERFDLNKDGSVSPSEFSGPPGAFRRADSNGDGRIGRSDR